MLSQTRPSSSAVTHEADEGDVYAEVIGVVPDLITDVDTTQPLAVYHPVPPDAAMGLRRTTLVLRASDDPDAVMRDAMATAKALDSRVTLERMRTLDEQIVAQMNPQRFGIYVLGGLGGIALLLTVLGRYVIVESMVVRPVRDEHSRGARRRERAAPRARVGGTPCGSSASA